MNSVEIEWQKLERLERAAKQQKVGAWGVSVGRLNTRRNERAIHGGFFRCVLSSRVRLRTDTNSRAGFESDGPPSGRRFRKCIGEK